MTASEVIAWIGGVGTLVGVLASVKAWILAPREIQGLKEELATVGKSIGDVESKLVLSIKEAKMESHSSIAAGIVSLKADVARVESQVTATEMKRAQDHDLILEASVTLSHLRQRLEHFIDDK